MHINNKIIYTLSHMSKIKQKKWKGNEKIKYDQIFINEIKR